MLDANWHNSKSLRQEIADFESMHVDKIIEMERRFIDGPSRKAVAKANEAERPGGACGCGRPSLRQLVVGPFAVRSDANTSKQQVPAGASSVRVSEYGCCGFFARFGVTDNTGRSDELFRTVSKNG